MVICHGYQIVPLRGETSIKTECPTSHTLQTIITSGLYFTKPKQFGTKTLCEYFHWFNHKETRVIFQCVPISYDSQLCPQLKWNTYLCFRFKFGCVGITYINQSDACVVGNTRSKDCAVIPTWMIMTDARKLPRKHI